VGVQIFLIPIVVFPTDFAPEVDSLGPHREPVKVYPRPVDLENTAKLMSFAGVTVVHSMEELERCL
jgi:flavoprotein